MTKYYLKQISKSCWNIQKAKAKVGFVRQTDDGFIAKIGDLKETGSSASQVFQAVCKAKNRVNICGENSAEKARAEILKRNEEVREEVGRFNAEMSELFKDGPRMRISKKRVNI